MADELEVFVFEGVEYVKKDAYDSLVAETEFLKASLRSLERLASSTLSALDRQRPRTAAAEEDHDSADQSEAGSESTADYAWKPEHASGQGHREDSVLVLNGWMFCSAHSMESCHDCGLEFRPCNNVVIEDQLPKEEFDALVDDGTIDDILDDQRNPLWVDGRWKRLLDGKPACHKHSTIDCKQCFNFTEYVVKGY